MLVPFQCSFRTVGLWMPDTSYGSGFTITLRNSQWLVTAAHVVNGFDVADIVLTTLDGPRVNRLTPVPMPQEGADIAVFAVEGELTFDFDLPASLDGLNWSQDTYFLGYPFQLGMQLDGNARPFVRRATASGIHQNTDGPRYVLLDGIVNEGFSGGPVVYNMIGSDQWWVAAVVAGFMSAPVPVRGGPGRVDINAGIVEAHDIGHALDAINAFVDG